MKRFLYWQIRSVLRPALAPWVPITVQRAWSTLAAAGTKSPRRVASRRVQMGAVRGWRFTPAASVSGRAILYLHGGAYVIGGRGSHGKLAGHVAHAARADVFFPDYRLAPEHPFPAARDDAVASYRWLLEQKTAAHGIVIAGDSAGAGLALAAALAIREAKLPAPAALALISPWVDLTLSGESHTSKRRRDPMLRASWLAASARHYAGGRPLDDPALSPVFGELAGLPPMLIQVGSEEILLSDAERLARRVAKARGQVKLQRFDGLWHDFQVHAGMLPDADRALTEIGAFVNSRWTH